MSSAGNYRQEDVMKAANEEKDSNLSKKKRISRKMSTPLKASSIQESTSNTLWWAVFLIVVAATMCTRLHKISEPDHVCWDETHFGKFGSWYINGTFFFDVHPPLGKMLIGLFGALTGYNGSFPFHKPGDKYGDTKFLGMRLCCMTLGSLLVPFAFITVWEMTESLPASVFSSLLILLDTGVLTLSQYILLDPILLFFVMGSVMSITKFYNLKNKPFTASWWVWLAVTGSFLACSISVKFVGLFVVMFVGLHTIYELWEILGDLSKPIEYSVKHFVARAVCLIILPAILYMMFFYIHLKVLSKSGSGDGFFSSAFQSQLEGNSLHNASMPREVAYGAVITLKNHRTGGGYLHSHWHLYPEGVGARQQQVTTYTHKDDNNKWLIKKFDKEWDYAANNSVELLRHGDIIRLEHLATRRNLHSHKEPAPVTKRHHQVTCYGEKGIGDANDVWKVEIIGGHDGDLVSTISHKLRFIHFLTGCALHSHNKQLPKWAYEQMEVTCNPNVRDKNNFWNVEDNTFEKLPNVSVQVYAPGFLEKFVESHAIMLQGNSGLKPKEGEVTSRPWQWPLNFRGQFFSGNQYRIYLLGNPLIWWGNLVCLFAHILVTVYHSVRYQRGYLGSKQQEAQRWQMNSACNWLLLAWALHYIPFYGMGRILYFHHYFPALIFNSMLSGIVVSEFIQWLPSIVPMPLKSTTFHVCQGGTVAIIVYSFYLYSPLSYGMDGPHSHEGNSTLAPLRLLDSWEF